MFHINATYKLLYFQVSFPSGFYSQVAVHSIKRIHSKSLLWGRCWRHLCDDSYCGAGPHISFSSTFSRDQEQSIGFVSCMCSIDAVSDVLYVVHVAWEVLRYTVHSDILVTNSGLLFYVLGKYNKIDQVRS